MIVIGWGVITLAETRDNKINHSFFLLIFLQLYTCQTVNFHSLLIYHVLHTVFFFELGIELYFIQLLVAIKYIFKNIYTCILKKNNSRV